MIDEHAKAKVDNNAVQKRSYVPPRLVCYGSVRDLTKNGTGTSNEQALIPGGPCRGGPTRKVACSERRVKENIVRVGTHPLGFGLYLFDYRPEHCDQWGHGRQFGVMIDEVEAVMPEAVSMHSDGYKRVDYGMLGISRRIH